MQPSAAAAGSQQQPAGGSGTPGTALTGPPWLDARRVAAGGVVPPGIPARRRLHPRAAALRRCPGRPGRVAPDVAARPEPGPAPARTRLPAVLCHSGRGAAGLRRLRVLLALSAPGACYPPASRRARPRLPGPVSQATGSRRRLPRRRAAGHRAAGHRATGHGTAGQQAGNCSTRTDGWCRPRCTWLRYGLDSLVNSRAGAGTGWRACAGWVKLPGLPAACPKDLASGPR